MAASPEQLHAMLQYCMKFARFMLEDCGDFLPFGASLSPSGTLQAVGGHNGEERPKPQELYRFLAGAFAAQAREGAILGAAVAANVNVPERYLASSRDALRVQLESAGYARYVYIPYRMEKSNTGGTVTSVVYGDPISVEIAPELFPIRGAT